MTLRHLFQFNNNAFTSTVLNFRIAAVFSNVHLLPLQSTILRRYSRRKVRKDSDFRHTLEDEVYECSEDVLKEKLMDKISELESNANLTRKIMTKKSVIKRQKEPRMLTYCEVQHMRALHSSSPDEWTPDILSECFPALPYMIRIILKMKWVPESIEKIKLLDSLVLENWEKLKRNELKCSFKYLEHLKKFINKSAVLKLQMNNPNFSYLPPTKNILTDTNGYFTSLIEDYEKNLNSATKKMTKVKLRDESSKECLSVEGGNNASDLIVKDDTISDMSLRDNNNNTTDLISKEDTANDLSLEQFNNRELKVMIKQKGFIPEYSESRGKDKPVTLEELKHSIFQKAEKHSFLSYSDKQIIQRTLTRHHLTPITTGKEIAVSSEKVKSMKSGVNKKAPYQSVKMEPIKSYETSEKAQSESIEMEPVKSYETSEKAPTESIKMEPRLNYETSEKAQSESIEMEPVKSYETSEKAPSESIKMEPRRNYEISEITKNVSHGKMELRKENLSSNEEYPEKIFKNLFRSSELNNILNLKSNEKTEEETNVQVSRKTTVPVNFYATEKDKEVYKKIRDDICNTSFWTSEKNNHSLYKNQTFKQNLDDSVISHNWKSPYPERINIPKEQVEKDKLYKLNDCYYDYKGRFLYRVPGMV